MKKFLTAILSSAVLCVGASVCVGNAFAASSATSLTQNCKSAYLCDYNSGECVYKQNETERMPIASVCKVMTLNLCFEAIDSGKIAFDDEITVSERAAGMGGSQVFLQNGLKYSVDNLIKSIIVCSANDSCVAMAETIAGSEEQFVASMNKKAAEFGCSNTLFANCTGLPKETQYSCAKDVAVMFCHLLSNEAYYNYSKVWLEDFNHPDGRITTITNTNKLLKRYNSCDGGKTGFTNEAKFCLASTAKKDNLRLVSVVLGADSSDDRFNSTINLFNYGFANYKNAAVLDGEVNLGDNVSVSGGKKESVTVRPGRSSYVFTAKDAKIDVTFNFVPYELKAPVKKGDLAGKIEVYKNGILNDEVDVVCAEDCEKANYGDILKNVAKNWTI